MKSLAIHIALLRQLERDRTVRPSRSHAVRAVVGLVGVALSLAGAQLLEELVLDRLGVR